MKKDSYLKNIFLNPKNISDGTPANAMVRFCYGWKVRNPSLMLEVCRLTWREKPQAKEKLMMWFGDIFLVGMKIKRINYINDTTYNIVMQIGMRHRNYIKPIVFLLKGRVFCESHAGVADVNGKWGVNPLSLLQSLGIVKNISINPDVLL